MTAEGWNAHHTMLDPVTRQTTITHDDDLVTTDEVVRRWCTDPDFCAFFNGVLADAPFACFRWETPVLTSATIGRPFVCVVVDSPGIDLPAERAPFDEHFQVDDGALVRTFANLGGDAVLVVPTPMSEDEAYPHVAAFCRRAPEVQRLALWHAVGEAVRGRVGSRPVWLSTAGGGVAWLHVRLDDRPKYYAHRPYTAR